MAHQAGQRAEPPALEHLSRQSGDGPPKSSRQTIRPRAGLDTRPSHDGYVPTATFHLLYVLLIVRHERRVVVHWNITDSPSTAWTAQQVVEAFPFDTVPEYLMRDRDAIYGRSFGRRVERLGIKEKVIAPRSPWQNPVAERLIGSIRRECLDRVIVLNERHLRRLLGEYCEYYHDARTHRSLGQDAPHPRAIEAPEAGKIIELPMVGWTASPLRPARRLKRGGSGAERAGHPDSRHGLTVAAHRN